MKIISGGQSGVDRAALEVALRRGIAYGGWCPRGGWAEDFPDPPGILALYPLLRETPLADPAQRTEWNVRDSDAVLIIVGSNDVLPSKSTALARDLAAQRKPLLVVDVNARDAAEHVIAWLRPLLRTSDHEEFALGIGGPRESEAPGIHQAATVLLDRVFEALRAA
jgi:hypothetical protein